VIIILIKNDFHVNNFNDFFCFFFKKNLDRRETPPSIQAENEKQA